MASIKPRNQAITARHLNVTAPLPALTANGTRTAILFAAPRHVEKASGDDNTYPLWRVIQVAIVTKTAFASAAGTVLLDVSVRDASEAANDLIVDDFNLEGLTANVISYATLVAETSEKERTLFAGDHIFASIISNNVDATGPAASDAAIILTLLPFGVAAESTGKALLNESE